MKVIKIILSVIFLILFPILMSFWSSSWKGIKLNFGWFGDCYGSDIGFPFNTLSCPPAGYFCICSSNSIASVFNFFFWLLVAIAILLLFIKIISKKKV